MKRWVFEKYGPFIEGTYCSDTVFHWRMAMDGLKPFFTPELRVDHSNMEHAGPYLRHEIYHGRCFANVRVSEQPLTPGQTLLRLVLSPALPFVLFARTCARIVRTGTYAREFIRAIPVVWIGITAWCLGESLGYFTHLVRPLKARMSP